VAWVCATCALGLQLTDSGLARCHPLGRALPPPASRSWLPFWVFGARCGFHQRLNYGGSAGPDELWQARAGYFVPAYACRWRSFRRWRRPHPPPAGLAARVRGRPAAGLHLSVEDAQHAAEFVVVSIEAQRKDKLRSIQFSLELADPELWLLPFSGAQPLL